MLKEHSLHAQTQETKYAWESNPFIFADYGSQRQSFHEVDEAPGFLCSFI